MAETPLRQQCIQAFSFERTLLLLAFSIAILLRLGHLGADPEGDEGVFFFLSYSLDHIPDRFMFLEFLRRPLLPLLYHPFSHSLETFRLANIVVGSFIPILVYILLKEYKLNKWLVLSGTILAVVNPILVRYSAFVFTDTLGTVFTLLMFLFFKKGNYPLSAIWLCLATLTKEYYAIAGLAILLIVLIEDKTITKRSISYALALLPITILYVINMGLLGMSAPGWDSSGITIWAFNYALLSLIFVPLYPLLLRFGRWPEFIMLCAYPAFYIVWHWGEGSGIDNWFHLFPASISIVCLCLILSDMAQHTQQTVGRFKKSSVLAISAILFITCQSLVLTLLFEVEDYGNDATVLADYVGQHYDNPNLMLVDCFWNYPNYPFHEVANASNAYTGNDTPSQIAESSQYFELVLIAKRDSRNNKELRAFDLGETIVNTDDYILLETHTD